MARSLSESEPTSVSLSLARNVLMTKVLRGWLAERKTKRSGLPMVYVMAAVRVAPLVVRVRSRE